MSSKMNDEQLQFWRALMAPFHPSELSEVPARGSKKVLTYLDKRALSNRLDSVCGPAGWEVSYTENARGYTCKIGILCPMGNGASVWHYKEDGAGFEEMGSKNRETGEFETDHDNDVKSGYTNAFRRAAQDAWGIGRYLYQKGIPTFLDPNATSPQPLPQIDPGMAAASVPPKELADKQTPPPSARQSPPQGNQRDNFKIPTSGKTVYGWAKDMERAFETQVVQGMAREGEERGWGSSMNLWSQPQVNALALGVMKFCRELPTYKGQFEHLFPGGTPDRSIEVAGAGAVLAANTEAPGVNVADVRRELLARRY